jgi:hypothetical protein
VLPPAPAVPAAALPPEPPLAATSSSLPPQARVARNRYPTGITRIVFIRGKYTLFSR